MLTALLVRSTDAARLAEHYQLNLDGFLAVSVKLTVLVGRLKLISRWKLRG